MTTSGRPMTKPTGRSPNSEVQSARQSKLVLRHFPRAPVMLNWLTSRNSLFAVLLSSNGPRADLGRQLKQLVNLS
jgi:hypothetical protein